MKRNVRRREIPLVVFATAAVVLLIYQQASSTVVVEPHGRQTQSRRRQRIPVPVNTGRDYSLFKHASHRNGFKCSDCHTIPSMVEPDLIAAKSRPNLVRGYPYHDSCFGCHRQQVYRGDRPVFCTVCHTRVSPRLTPRDVYSQFPNPKRGDIIASEFPGYFPHALHQSQAQCTECHLADERAAITLPVKGIQSEETFQRIEANTFKTIPGERGVSAHASCFGCHWQKEKPNKDECNGCHLSPFDYQTGKNPITGERLEITQPRSFSPNAEKWFKNWPTDLPKRFSLKFNHQSGDHASDKTCLSCHANIAQMTTLNIPKADVLISACISCHKDEPIKTGGGVSVTIPDEMDKKAKDSTNYSCVACHTSVIGREQPPCTHYAVIGQTCPQAGQVRKE